MVGVPMRSGGHNLRVAAAIIPGDGPPESPRELSPAAAGYFAWLVERLRVDEAGSKWHRVDGCLLASMAELLESEERLGSMLRADPTSERLLRLRMQHADRVAKLSALLGLCPRDRERLPRPVVDDGDPAARAWLAEHLGWG